MIVDCIHHTSYNYPNLKLHYWVVEYWHHGKILRCRLGQPIFLCRFAGIYKITPKGSYPSKYDSYGRPLNILLTEVI